MQTLETKKKDIVGFFLKKGMLISHDLLKYLEDKKNIPNFYKLVEGKHSEDITVLSKRIKEILERKQDLNLDWSELEKSKAILEKKGSYDDIIFKQIQNYENASKTEKTNPEGNVKVIFSYNGLPKKREAKDFIQYFNNRYQTMLTYPNLKFRIILRWRAQLLMPTILHNNREVLVCGLYYRNLHS